VPPGRPRRPGPQPPQLQVHLVGHHQQIANIDLEELQQSNDHGPAQVHERERLGEDHVSLAPSGSERFDAARGRLPIDPVPSREQIEDVEADVVPRSCVAGARVAHANDELHVNEE
jgi:hypothetical protein